MSVSVILSSYNQSKSLYLALTALLRQDMPDFDVIIADDGSEGGLAAMVEDFARTASFPIHFLTQADDGFRKSTILNKAIVFSKSEKLIFLDGDCLALPNHISQHTKRLKPGYFCVGGRVMLTLEQSLEIDAPLIAENGLGRFVTPQATAYLKPMHRTSVLQGLWNSRRSPRFIGANFSAMRNDLLLVNGFDETFNGQGKEDSDLRNRLRNSGRKGISLLTQNIVCHLDHGLDKKSTGGVKRKADRQYYYTRLKATTAVKGINELES